MTGVFDLVAGSNGLEVAANATLHAVVAGSNIFSVAASGALLLELTEPRAIVTALALAPRAEHILAGTDEGAVHVFDARTGTSLGVYLEHTASVTSIAVDSGGSRVVSASADGSVRGNWRSSINRCWTSPATAPREFRLTSSPGGSSFHPNLARTTTAISGWDHKRSTVFSSMKFFSSPSFMWSSAS